jgi:hypothetical protein
MEYRMYGDTVQLLRYIITWEKTRQGFDENGEPCDETAAEIEYCVSDEHRDEVLQHLDGKPCTVEAIDQTGNEWLDGMEFKDASKVPEALAVGEPAYRQFVNDSDANLQFAKYLTDLDFRLLLLEWGIV